IPLEHKDQALRELRRVLAPGGLTLHYVETSADDPLSRFARRYPELYERYVVAPEGHVGVEPAAALFARFRAAGFVPLAEIAAYKGFIYVDRVLQYFDNEYCERSWPLRLLVAACRPLARVRPLAAAANLAVTLLVEAADHVLPSAWAGGALVFYAKGS
ncbi:MAG TPA: hypothetical protein PLB78_12880, partial [Anaerolineae bacterium]|nr:hypothetical protein [Anaerolineae bacterium]